MIQDLASFRPRSSNLFGRHDQRGVELIDRQVADRKSVVAEQLRVDADGRTDLEEQHFLIGGQPEEQKQVRWHCQLCWCLAWQSIEHGIPKNPSSNPAGYIFLFTFPLMIYLKKFALHRGPCENFSKFINVVIYNSELPPLYYHLAFSLLQSSY